MKFNVRASTRRVNFANAVLWRKQFRFVDFFDIRTLPLSRTECYIHPAMEVIARVKRIPRPTFQYYLVRVSYEKLPTFRYEKSVQTFLSSVLITQSNINAFAEPARNREYRSNLGKVLTIFVAINIPTSFRTDVRYYLRDVSAIYDFRKTFVSIVRAVFVDLRNNFQRVNKSCNFPFLSLSLSICFS